MGVTSEERGIPKAMLKFIALITQMTRVVVNEFSLQPFFRFVFSFGFLFRVNLAQLSLQIESITRGSE